MTRRRKSTTFVDLLTIVAWFPWWVGVLIGVIGYVVLHRLATPTQAVAMQPDQMANFVTHAMVTALASIGQFVVPLIGILGAGTSFFKRKKRIALLSDTALSQSVSVIDGMSWHEFELLVGEAYRQQGYRVTETGGNGPDGGVDLMLTKGGEKFFVQCKHWRAFKVGVEVVRALYGVMAAKGATGGFVVTSGRFTKDAVKFAQGRNVELVDGPQFAEMIQGAKRSLGASSTASTGSTPVETATEPACPLCGTPMVKRKARQGVNAGNAFWGCSKFPSCRGIRSIQ